jgi:hypothetical protein
VEEYRIYVTARNADLVIGPCLKPVVEVFGAGRVTLIDLGSTDDTVDIARWRGVSVVGAGVVHSRDYSALKNEYSARHEWVYWIDADEVYPIRSLQLVKERIENPSRYPYITINAAWRVFLVKEGKLLLTDPTPQLLGKGKGHLGNAVKYDKQWPYEIQRVLTPYTERDKEKRGPTEIFCYHTVLLNNSSEPEITGMRKKRVSKTVEYLEKYKWREVVALPWDAPPEALVDLGGYRNANPI